MARPPQQTQSTAPPTGRRGSGAPGLVAVALLLAFAGPALAGNQGDLILNEINAVGETKFLRGKGATFVDAYVNVADDEIYVSKHSFDNEQGPFRLTTTGTLPSGLSLGVDYYSVYVDNSNIGLSLTPGGAKVDITEAISGGTHALKLPDELGDSYFGVVAGNGGNWLELVVVADHLDIRGWTLEWTNFDDPGDCNSGTVTFESHEVWSNLRSGTIITIAEDLPDDVSYDPPRGDWWINANHEEVAVSHTNCFKVDNDCWRMRILDNGVPTVIQDWVGEQDPGDPPGEPACLPSDLWGSTTGNISSEEVGKLEQDPSAAAATSPPVPLYNDGTSSTFGSANRWEADTMQQDFSELRSVVISVPSLTDTGLGALAGVIVAIGLWGARRRASAV